MNIPSFRLAALAAAWLLPCPPLAADPPPIVEIPDPIADGRPSPPAPKPEPIDFHVLESRTRRMAVSHAPEMPELPPVAGIVDVTVQMVADPGLPDPPPPLPALPPGDPAVLARIAEFRENRRAAEFVFVSCEVYDHHRTLVRVHPNGQAENSVTAVSNVDFNHFTGFSTYRVRESDGSSRDVAMLLGISSRDTARIRARMARHGRDYQPPALPGIPDLAGGGPAFAVMEGDAAGPAGDVLREIHRLYAGEGARMEAAFHAREQARAERKTYLLANPPRPENVTIRFWKRDRPAAGESAGEGEGVEP